MSMQPNFVCQFKIYRFIRLFKEIRQMTELNSKNIAPMCPLCKNDFDVYYRTPRVVPKCGHTYCEKCIANRLVVKASRKVFICPECSSEVIIRKGVQEDVPKNIGIIDVVKNLKKFSTNERQQQRKPAGDLCSQHQRPLELVCETCAFKKICSHCVLFGQHHSHQYRKEAPATSLNLKQVKQVYQLLANSVKLVLLPDSECNLKRTMKGKMSEGLKKSVKAHFKQYYDMLERKQFQLLQQCQNIVISEGGIDNNIDKLVIDYDNIKNKYEIDWSFAIDHNNLGKFNKSITVNSLEDFISKCQDLHNKVISIQDQAMQHIEAILKDIGLRISQSIIFKIQQFPFSLKKIVENLGKDKQEITSPQKRVRLKSNASEIKSKSVIEKDQGKGHLQMIDKIERNSNKSQTKSIIAKKSKNTYSQIDREQSVQDDFSLLEAGKSDLRSFKQQTQNHKQLKQLIANKNIPGERGSLPPKANKAKNISDYDSKTMNLKQAKEEDKARSMIKELSPAKTVSLLNKQVNSLIVPSQSIEQLKFSRPTKQISFQFLSKFQELMVQTDRQSQQNTLELVGLEINDTLLLYLLDYLRVKKIRFQVIKLVKNSITDEGFKTILSFLVNDNMTQLLNMTSNQLTSRALDIIVLFAGKNRSLKTIYLGGNKINATQIKSKKNQLSQYQLQIVI